MVISLDKIQVIKGTPPCQPGKCVVCGNCGDPEMEFLDFGFEIEFYGVVYFCKLCIRNLIQAMELVPQDEFSAVQMELHQKEFMYNALKSENEELRSVIGSLNRFGISTNHSSVDSDSSKLVLDEKSEADKSVSDESKSGPTKQINESRSASVRNTNRTKKSVPESDDIIKL